MTSGTRELLGVAEKAAAVARHAIRSSVGELSVFRKPGLRDLTTELDYRIEDSVRELLAKETPGFGVLGEERGGSRDVSGPMWVIDPIDGTVNFQRGLPLCGFSIALVDGGSPTIGVIDLPFLDERYTAVRDGGATANGHTIHVSATASMEHASIAVGDFPVDPAADGVGVAHQATLLHSLGRGALRTRMLGSAAIDLAWVASGKLDASVTLFGEPWDVAAGVLIVQEAHGFAIDLGSAPWTLESRVVLATNRALKDVILAEVQRVEALDVTER